jgi:hypothetical protein
MTVISGETSDQPLITVFDIIGCVTTGRRDLA